MNRPVTLAELAQILKADSSALHNALAGFLDDFYTNVDRRQSMIDAAPELVGDAELDAFLGGVGEHLARRWDLRIPAWTEAPERFLKSPYFPTPLEELKPLLIAQSPLAFRRRLIFLEHEPLRRARMPLAKGM